RAFAFTGLGLAGLAILGRLAACLALALLVLAGLAGVFHLAGALALVLAAVLGLALGVFGFGTLADLAQLLAELLGIAGDSLLILSQSLLIGSADLGARLDHLLFVDDPVELLEELLEPFALIAQLAGPRVLL